VAESTRLEPKMIENDFLVDLLWKRRE